MAKPKKVSKIKTKKKRWFPVLAPGFLGQKEVGETYLAGPEAAKGRVLKINLRDLTGSIQDQMVNVSLRITETGGKGLQTEIIGYAFMPSFVKKLVRKGAGKVDDSFILENKEGKRVQLKPMVVTVFMVNKSMKTRIRKGLRELLAEEVSKLGFESLISDFLRRRLQIEFKKKLNKICPVREVMMRAVKLEERKRVKVLERKIRGKEAEEGAEEAETTGVKQGEEKERPERGEKKEEEEKRERQEALGEEKEKEKMKKEEVKEEVKE